MIFKKVGTGRDGLESPIPRARFVALPPGPTLAG